MVCSILFIILGVGFVFAKSAGIRHAVLKTVAPTKLQGEDQGRTNVLVMGMTADGLRTDSLMLVSYYYQQNKVVTLNIPRDLYAYDGYETDKLGSLYAWAQKRRPTDPTYPEGFVSNFIAKEYGVPIHYWVKADMNGEKQLVDQLGGIDVNVPNSFIDYMYPTDNYHGYIRPAPSFKAGPQHMDGTTALIFSRSRHSGDNNEGSDFARSKRQQLVIQSAISKAKSKGVFGNLAEVNSYLRILGDNVSSNISTAETVRMASVLSTFDSSQNYLSANWSTANGFICGTVSRSGLDILLYGATGNCTTEAGGTEDSQYRQQAQQFVQNLYQSAQQSQAQTPAPVNTLGVRAN